MKKIYLADVFRLAADKHLINGQWNQDIGSDHSKYSCCAAVYALEKLSNRNFRWVNYAKKAEQRNKHLKSEQKLKPAYELLDYMRSCGVPCGSERAFKGSKLGNYNSQNLRFLLLNFMAEKAESEDAFVVINVILPNIDLETQIGK